MLSEDDRVLDQILDCGWGNTHLPEGDTHGKKRERFESLILRKTLRTPRVSVDKEFAHNHLTEVAVLFELLLPPS